MYSADVLASVHQVNVLRFLPRESLKRRNRKLLEDANVIWLVMLVSSLFLWIVVLNYSQRVRSIGSTASP